MYQALYVLVSAYSKGHDKHFRYHSGHITKQEPAQVPGISISASRPPRTSSLVCLLYSFCGHSSHLTWARPSAPGFPVPTSVLFSLGDPQTPNTQCPPQSKSSTPLSTTCSVRLVTSSLPKGQCSEFLPDLPLTPPVQPLGPLCGLQPLALSHWLLRDSLQ